MSLARQVELSGNHAGEVTAVEPGVDVDCRDIRGAAVQDRQQAGQAMKVRSVANAGRHGDHRAIDQPAQHAG